LIYAEGAQHICKKKKFEDTYTKEVIRSGKSKRKQELRKKRSNIYKTLHRKL